MFFYSYCLLYGWNTWSGELSSKEDISRTTHLQDEVGILIIMWLCEGKGVTCNSEVKRPSPLRPSVEGVSYPVANEAVGWMVDSTACTTEGVKSWAVDMVYGNRVRRLEEELVY